MYEAITYVSQTGGTADLLESTGAGKGISWKYEMAGDDFPKQADSGQHPAAVVVRRLTITYNGQIQGIGDDDAVWSMYWSCRATLMAALIPDEGPPTAYVHGRLTVKPQGGNSMYADVNVIDNEFPTTVDEAGTSLYTVTWRCDRGYWLATSGDTVVKL